MEEPSQDMRNLPVPFNGLKIATIVMGAIGLVLWGCALGFPIGYCTNVWDTLLWSIVFVPLNIGYIYYTMKIIYVITSVSFPSEPDLASVRDYSSKLVAATVVGLALFIIAVCWFARDSERLYVEYTVAFGCSFSFIWPIIVFPMATAYTRKVSLIYFGIEKKKSRKVVSSGYYEDPYRHPHGSRHQKKGPAPAAPIHRNSYY